MRGNTTENLQHRRQQRQHRPAYLAPSAGHIQIQQQDYHRRYHHHHHKFHQYERVDDDYSDDNNHYDDDNYDIIEDLRIPLFVKVPCDEKQFPIISPPSSEGSAATAVLACREKIPFYSPFIIPSLSQSQHHYHRQPQSSSQSLSSSIQQKQKQQQQYTLLSSSPGPGPILSFKQKLYKTISSIYYVVLDLLLLIFVCLMGLFFHVEVQVVKHGNHGRNDIDNNGRGRIIIQHQQQQQQQTNNINNNNKNNDTQYHQKQGYHQYNRDYYRDHNHSTDLLLQQPISMSTPPRSIDTTADDNTYSSNPYLMLLGDEMV